MKTWSQVILVNLALTAVGLRLWLDPWPAVGEVALLDLVRATDPVMYAVFAGVYIATPGLAVFIAGLPTATRRKAAPAKWWNRGRKLKSLTGHPKGKSPVAKFFPTMVMMHMQAAAQEYNIQALRFSLLAIIAILTVTAVSLPTISAQDSDRDAQRLRLQKRLTEARARLRLTDDQIEQIQPILRSSVEAQARVLRKHGIDLERRSGKDRRLGFRQLRRLGRDLDAVRQQTIEKLSGKLTDAQIEEYRKIQQELRQAMRKRLRQRRR